MITTDLYFHGSQIAKTWMVTIFFSALSSVLGLVKRLLLIDDHCSSVTDTVYFEIFCQCSCMISTLTLYRQLNDLYEDVDERLSTAVLLRIISVLVIMIEIRNSQETILQLSMIMYDNTYSHVFTFMPLILFRLVGQLMTLISAIMAACIGGIFRVYSLYYGPLFSALAILIYSIFVSMNAAYFQTKRRDKYGTELCP